MNWTITMLRSTDSWVCYYSQLHKEKLAEASLQGAGFEVFLPLCVKLIKRKNKYVQSIRPLFSRYIFARHGEDLMGGKRLNGISGFAGKSLEVSFVHPLIVDAIRERQDGRGVILLKKHDLVPGQSVRVLSGPFSGLEAVFSEVDDHKRSFILLDLMGKTHRLRVTNSSIGVAT